MTLGALYYIKKDFVTTKTIRNNSSFPLFFYFFSICIVATVANGNGFKKFNNIYFIIHSAIFFFLIMQENNNSEDYLYILNFIIILITATLSFISTLTILIFLCNKIGFTSKINSIEIQNLFYLCAPLSGRWYTLIQNPNTFGHLVSMSFFLNIIPYKTLRKKIYKNLLIIMVIINTILLILTGSRGALSAFLGGVIMLIIFSIIKICKNNKRNILMILLALLFISLILFFANKILFSFSYFKNFLTNILRINNYSTSKGRINTWSNLLNLPFFSNPFGFNDDYLYHYLEDLNAFYPQGFLNNSGRAHNMYLEILVSYGIIAFGIFIACMVKTFIQIKKSYHSLSKEDNFLFLVFFLQFIAILIGGMVEQLPIFSLSAHSLIFMFVWANLLTLTENRNK